MSFFISDGQPSTAPRPLKKLPALMRPSSQTPAIIVQAPPDKASAASRQSGIANLACKLADGQPKRSIEARPPMLQRCLDAAPAHRMLPPAKKGTDTRQRPTSDPRQRAGRDLRGTDAVLEARQASHVWLLWGLSSVASHAEIKLTTPSPRHAVANHCAKGKFAASAHLSPLN